MKHIDKIINSPKTVFTPKDLRLLLGYKNKNSLNSFLQRASKKNILHNIRQGIWVLSDYNNYELACKLRDDVYVSLETVLYKSGIIFQQYESTITCISNDSRSYEIDGVLYRYSKLKDEILLTPKGIKQYDTYSIASLERALCDIIYLNSNFSVDSLDNINEDKLLELSSLYSKRTSLDIKKLLTNHVK